MTSQISSASSALSAYVSQLVSGANASTAATTSGATQQNAPTKAAQAAALTAAAHTTGSTIARTRLAREEAGVTKDLRAAMTKAGVQLGASVSFAIGPNGALTSSGSATDRAAIDSFLKNDKSSPSFSARLKTLVGDADNVSKGIRQTAAISQAARSSAGAAGVMALYGTLVQQQNTTPASFSISGTTASLTYPGMLASSA